MEKCQKTQKSFRDSNLGTLDYEAVVVANTSRSS